MSATNCERYIDFHAITSPAGKGEIGNSCQRVGTYFFIPTLLLRKGFTMTSLASLALLQLSLIGADTTSYTSAYKSAMESGKPLVVLIGADWCPHCARMKQSSIPEVQRQGGFQDAAFAIVDSDRQG